MNIPNPAYIEEVKELVGASPFFRHMGMRLAAMDIGTAEIHLSLGNSHIQPFGLVHGGVIATLIDTATFWAVYLQIGDGDGLVNVDLKLNYLKSVTHGRLRAIGTSIRSGRTICYSEASVFDEADQLLAHGTSTLMVRPGSGLNTQLTKFISSD